MIAPARSIDPLSGLHLAMTHAASAVFNGRGARARLSILLYHRVAGAPDPLRMAGIPERDFDWQMRLVARCFNPLPLSEAVVRLRRATLPPRAICVTFDDGYADNAEVALPVLRAHGVPATFFVATGFLGGGCMFNDQIIEAVRASSNEELDLSAVGLGRHRLSSPCERIRAINLLLTSVKHLDPSERDERVQQIVHACAVQSTPELMMTPTQVAALVEAGMEVGAHTVTHPILKSVSEQRARDEIAEGREQLAAITGQPVNLFAYPNGKPGIDYNREHVAMVRELGFHAAVSTVWGSSHSGSDCFQLARFTPWDKQPTRFLTRLIANWRRDARVLV